MSGPLDVLFLTNFSDACFRATPALAQMADDLELRLHILHAYNPHKDRRADIEAKLRSFFPEADGFASCRRSAIAGSLGEAIERINQERAIDMIVAPPADPLGLPRILPSRRADLITQVGTLLWTTGTAISPIKLRRRPKRIACWLDFHGDKTKLKVSLQMAIRYAEALKGTLQILYMVPDLLEGTLSPPTAPLHAAEVEEALQQHIPGTIARPEIHVSTSGGYRAVIKLLRRCDADLLILGSEQATVSGLFGTRMAPLITRAPCAVVCVGEKGASVTLSPRHHPTAPPPPTNIVSLIP